MWAPCTRRPGAARSRNLRARPATGATSAAGAAGAAVVAVLAITGCGSSSASSGQSASHSPPAVSRSSTASATTAAAASVDADIRTAERPRRMQFPAAAGRSLIQLGKLVKSTAQLGAATGTYTPGTRRFAFALNTSGGQFLYAPTAIYISKTPGGPATGPFLAPADPLAVPARYRSRQNAGPGDIQAIYATQVPVPRAGTYTVLSLTHTARGLVGAPGEIAVAASSPIPDVGRRPPAIATDTAATVHANTTLLTTRLPPEHMSAVSLADALGKRPIALLFSTPQLCTSRVCGPVTDVAVSLQHRFGDRVAFIHQEIYVDNQPQRGLRQPLKAFRLRTEPWLFVINRRGIIVARLEGAFGTAEMIRALQAALR